MIWSFAVRRCLEDKFRKVMSNYVISYKEYYGLVQVDLYGSEHTDKSAHSNSLNSHTSKAIAFAVSVHRLRWYWSNDGYGSALIICGQGIELEMSHLLFLDNGIIYALFPRILNKLLCITEQCRPTVHWLSFSQPLEYFLGSRDITSRKHTYIILTTLNPTSI